MSAARPLPASPAPTATLPPVSAARPITLDDIAAIRADLVVAQRTLDDLLWVAGDATSPQPVCTPEAQRVDVDRHGAELRTLLLLCGAKVDAIMALLRLAQDQRARNRALLEQTKAVGRAGGSR